MFPAFVLSIKRKFLCNNLNGAVAVLEIPNETDEALDRQTIGNTAARMAGVACMLNLCEIIWVLAEFEAENKTKCFIFSLQLHDVCGRRDIFDGDYKNQKSQRFLGVQVAAGPAGQRT